MVGLEGQRHGTVAVSRWVFVREVDYVSLAKGHCGVSRVLVPRAQLPDLSQSEVELASAIPWARLSPRMVYTSSCTPVYLSNWAVPCHIKSKTNKYFNKLKILRINDALRHIFLQVEL